MIPVLTSKGREEKEERGKGGKGKERKGNGGRERGGMSWICF